MAGFTQENAQQLRELLQDATMKCSERCLYQSAKWAAELSISLALHLDDSHGQDQDPDAFEQQVPPRNAGLSTAVDPHEARSEARELGRYLLAKSYFDCREFERCAAVFLPSGLPKQPLTRPSPASNLRSPRGSGKGKAKETSRAGYGGKTVSMQEADNIARLSQKALFLALYAKYMAGEKKKHEESEMIMGPQDKGAVVNKELVNISLALETYFTSRGPDQSSEGWLEYLYGVVLAKAKNEEEARRWLIRSVHLCPYNWSAWLELNGLLGSDVELRRVMLELPHNVMTLMFHLYASQELYQSTAQVHREVNDLEIVFPGSQFLKTQRALLFYHSKDYDEAESIFASILQEDPYRVDSLDHYSNILFVMGARPKLAFIAQLAMAVDRFRPETCCVVGNYYSLKSEHEKAVQYFRRALTLDRTFLSAWTLMGHEYVEMKNTHAAIESYRRAVDVNRKDYRAWYGLGQTYEVLEMHLYALFYYQRAASLHPYDSKMWLAVGSCYDKVGRPHQSIKAYKRALVAGTYYDASVSFGSGATTGVAPDGFMVSETLYNIALMHEKMNDMQEAAVYMEMTLAQEDGYEDDDGGGGGADDDEQDKGPGIGVTNTTSKARIWLARWAFARGELKRAMELANELCQDGVEVEEAKALIRDLRARMEA